MSLADQLERLLPRLRRYARAVTGSAPAGDASVERFLRQVLDGVVVLPPGEDLDVHAFAAFETTLFEGRASGADGVIRNKCDIIGALSSSARRALLLTAMEAFSTEEACVVLGCAAEQLDSLLAEAELGVERMLASRVLIIEDEPLIAANLARLVGDMGHSVAGTAMTRAEALALNESAAFDIVLADRRLADGSSGHEVACEIQRSRDVPVVYITAHPESLSTGGADEPALLILKPFKWAYAQAVITQALLMRRR